MRNDYTDYIMHSSKGEERKNHKYKAREWVKGKWQYIYDEKLGGRAKREFENANVRYINAVNDAKVKARTAVRVSGDWDNSSPADALRAQKKALNASNKLDQAAAEAVKKRDKYFDSPIGKLDNAKDAIKDVGDKLFAKHNEKKDAKKTAEQRKAREEGMAERERQKTEANNWRATETRQNEQFRKAKADIRDANAAKREANYGKDAAAKSESERKQYLETRLKDVGRAREKQEKQLEDTVDKYVDEYIKALQGKDNDMSSATGKLAEEALRLSHIKAIEAIYQRNVKDASIYGNANSSSYSLINKNDYLDKLEKEYRKLMG